MVESQKKISQAKAIFYIILGSIFIALAPFFVEKSGLDAINSSFYRLSFGAIAFFVIAFIQRQVFPEWKFWWLYLISGVVIILDLVAWNKSVLLIGPGLATVLANLEVVFLIFIGFIFFKEEIPKKFFRKLLILVLGLFCLISPYLMHIEWSNTFGVGLGLIASLVYSLYLIMLKIINQKIPDIAITANLAVICLFGSFILGIFVLIVPGNSIILPTGWDCVGCVLFNSLLSQVLGWTLVAKGVSNVNLSLSGLVLLVQPALTFMTDYMVFARNTKVIQVIGCVIILLAVSFILKTHYSYNAVKTLKK